ncbi:hypothetical protein BSKO_10103 [Bryopsis sp. KO-2023]|nr:hypothetical protein BSKO_10103 [Bryopsis sp. KO-2023]
MVFCRSAMGTLALESNCDKEEMDAIERVEICETESCTKSEFFYRLEPWGACDRACGGGKRFRAATCFDSSTGDIAPKEACRDLPESITERECNTAPCEAFRFDIDPWNECSKECGGGVQSRRVECVSSLRTAVQDDTMCILANLTRPSSQQDCNVFGCPDPVERGQRKLLQSASADLCQGFTCSGNGNCDNGVCTCDEGFEGPDCQFDIREELRCAGSFDGAGECCQSGIFSIGGDCCVGKNTTLDRNGLCCEGVVDACGECGGGGLYVDVLGQCCSTILDGGGVCCSSARIDECGVCDGDGSSCHLEVSAVLEMEDDVEVNDIMRCLADKVAGGSTVKDKVFNVVMTGQEKGKKDTMLMNFIITGAMASTFSIKSLVENSSSAASNGSSDPCIAQKIDKIVRVPTHGNNMCEIGEMSGVPGFGKENPFEFRQDCRHEFTACPAPNGNFTVIGDGMCSGNGKCMFASGGICDCFVGYDGVACDRCAANWFERNGRCHPRQKLVALAEGDETPRSDGGGGDNVSQAAVISAGLLGGVLVVLLLATVIMAKIVSKKRRADPPEEEAEEAATTSTESYLSNEERSLSTIWRAFLSEIGSQGSGVTPTVDLVPSPAATEEGEPSGHARTVSMTDSMGSTSTAAEGSGIIPPVHGKSFSSETWFTATSQGFSNMTEYFTARESFSSSSQLTSTLPSGSLVS